MFRRLDKQDDLDLAGRTLEEDREAFEALKPAASRKGLLINTDQTNYMCENQSRISEGSQRFMQGTSGARIRQLRLPTEFLE